jgi:hypothetical protein
LPAAASGNDEAGEGGEGGDGAGGLGFAPYVAWRGRREGVSEIASLSSYEHLYWRKEKQKYVVFDFRSI